MVGKDDERKEVVRSGGCRFFACAGPGHTLGHS